MNPIKTEYNYQLTRPLSEKNSSYEKIFHPSNLLTEQNEILTRNKRHFDKYKKAYTDSVTNIFQSKIYANSKEPKICSKPNKGDFESLSKAAKNNLSERYYFDNNFSQV